MGHIPIRIGHGFDVHALAPGFRLVIGGVEIEHPTGLVGHSDADVLLHALCDALLGAAALGDIGKHFPPTDEAYKGIDSRILLRLTAKLLIEAGYKIGNLDATIIAEAPKMAAYIPQMRKQIAEDLGLTLEEVSIKATTTERLSFVGREEGIAAEASVLIFRID